MNAPLFAHACASEPKVLRPHQVEALRLVRLSLAQGHRRTVCQMPTGAGKTVTAANMVTGACAKGNKVIFTVPALSLIDQTVEAFEAEGIRDIGVMQANHPRTDRLAQVQVASVQTLARRHIPEAALVIVDECHIKADVIDKLMKDRPDVFFIGLSATPWRQGMGRTWQDLVIPTTIGDLIEAGMLSSFTAYAPDVPDLSGVKIRAGEYVESALQEIMGESKLVGHVVETWLAKGEDRPTLCFAVNRAHAALLKAEFEAHGIASAYVDANTDGVERAAINRRFRHGEVRVICSVRTMTTGVDLPVSCIIDAAPTASEMLHVQKIGRGLRVNPGTEDCLILDHAGNSLRLGLVTDIHHEKLDDTKPGTTRKTLPKAEKLPTQCANCGALQIGRVCPFCGHEKPLPKVDVAEGELVPLTGKVKAATLADKQWWLSQLAEIGRQRGYKPGWASRKFKERFGVWPAHQLDASIPPIAITPEVSNWVRSRMIAYAKAKGGAQ